MILNKKLNIRRRLPARLRKRFYRRYGKASNSLVNLFIGFQGVEKKRSGGVFHKLSYGIYDSINDSPRHRYKKETVNGSIRMLSGASMSDFYSHFLSARKNRFLWYSNNLPYLTCQNGERLRFALLCLDIDYRGAGASDALAVWAVICSHYPILSNSSYVESSTNGKGLHVYVSVSFSVSSTNEAIRERIAGFSTSLREKTRGVGIASFDAIKGLPVIYETGNPGIRLIKTMGTLAKVPHPQSEKEAQELLKVCESPISFEVLEGPSTGALLLHSKEEGGFVPPKPLLEKELTQNNAKTEKDLQESLSDIDAFERMKTFAFETSRKLNRPISENELLEAYEKSGLATGERTSRRISRAKQISKYIAENFIPCAKKKTTKEPADFLEPLGKKITPEMLEEYKASDGGKLLLIDVAAVYCILCNLKDYKKTVGLSVSNGYLKAQILKLRQKKTYLRGIDNKKLAACKRLLDAAGFIKIHKVGNNYAGCSNIQVY